MVPTRATIRQSGAKQQQDTSKCPHPGAWQRWSQCQLRPAPLPPPPPPPPRPLESPLLRGAVLSYAGCHVRPPPVALLPWQQLLSHVCQSPRQPLALSHKGDGPFLLGAPSLPLSCTSDSAGSSSHSTLCAPTALALFPRLSGESICFAQNTNNVLYLSWKILPREKDVRGGEPSQEVQKGGEGSCCADSGRTESGSQKVLVLTNYSTACFRDFAENQVMVKSA